MSIFQKRVVVRPYEYPQLLDYMKAIRQSYWVVDEFNFNQDIQDYKINLSNVERSIITRTLLVISNIEVSVKSFWAKVGDNLPKPEVYMVGYTFAESEVRHMEAYSELLRVLGLDEEFANTIEEPVLKGRIDYLTKYLKGASENTKENYALNLLLFSAFIENCSLFSQFLIIKAFSKSKNQLTVVDNVVQATAKEEEVHFNFGAALINIIKKENPDWFDEHFYEKIYRACKKAYEAEMNIVDWIFAEGELPFLPKIVIDEFIKDRFNGSLKSIGGNPLFEVNQNLIKEVKWFNEELYAYNRNDFFSSQSVQYAKRTQSITAEDLF